MLIRPKSMATVVVVFPPTPRVSSTPILAVVSAASVVSGGISLTEPTKVVLPTPNPPAMTIFTGLGADGGADAAPLEGLKSMEHLLHQC
jgi:hypothetical protein